MDHVGPMAERDALDHLVDVVAQTFRVYAHCVLLEHFKQVLLYVLEDEIQAALPTNQCLHEIGRAHV